MKMKRILVTGALSVFALLLTVGCEVTIPQPIADGNSPALPEPISYYGDVEFFDEKRAPLSVSVTEAAGAEALFLADTLKKALANSGINCVAPGKNCDIRLTIDSGYRELTPAPQCRLAHQLSISVAAADGRRLQPVWQHKTETVQAYLTADAAKAGMKSQISKSVELWQQKKFDREVTSALKVSIVRFRMSRGLVELDPIRFEKDLRIVLNKLHQLKGAVDVRLIEANKETRIASFRILCRNGVSLRKQIQDQK